MKRKILIIFGILLLFGSLYFFYLNKKLNGIWIHNYGTNLENGSYSYSGRTVLEIKNQKFNYHSHSANGGVGNQTYFYYGKSLGLWPRPTENNSFLRIDQFDTDSIVFGGFEYTQTFKKVPDSLKNSKDFKLNLKNKAFVLKQNEINTDTIFFTDKLLLSRLLNDPYQKWISNSWEKLKIGKFDFLLTADWTTFIVKQDGAKIFFYGFENERGKNQLSRLELIEIEMNLTDINRDLKRIKRHQEKVRELE